MKVALIGYGKMGREVECVAARGHTIPARLILKRHDTTLDFATSLGAADVSIEFTNPGAIWRICALWQP
jgi:4-hydroxy-tetrahydrodipicolinate reductase